MKMHSGRQRQVNTTMRRLVEDRTSSLMENNTKAWFCVGRRGPVVERVQRDATWHLTEKKWFFELIDLVY